MNKKEYMKIYCEKNKDRLLKYRKRYCFKNRDKINERVKKYYQEHKQERIDYMKEWIKKNKEKIKETYKKHYELNREKLSKQKRKYYIKNRKQMLKYHKKYRETHKEKIILNRSTPNSVYSHIKYNALKRNIKVLISKEDFLNWYNKQKKVCIYCNRTLEEIKQDEVNNLLKGIKEVRNIGVDRKDNNKGYEFDNIDLCCKRCNETKNNNFSYKEMLKIGKLLRKIYNKRKIINEQ